MKPYYRSILGVSLVSALVMAPLLWVALRSHASAPRQSVPLQSLTEWGDDILLSGLFFTASFIGIFVVLCLFVYLRAALDKIEPPFPK